jgi:hypothetical protein
MRCILTFLSVLAAILVTAPVQADKLNRDLAAMPKVTAGSVRITGEYFALIIGVDQYHHAPHLESAVKDATGVRDVLIQRYGFKREQIIELFNGQATRTNIENALHRLGRESREADSVFIYFAGHGQYEEDGRIGWWVPVEGRPQEPGTFITNSSIRDYIGGMRARHVYLVVDSCFSGSLFSKSRTMPPLNDQWFVKLYERRSRWVLTSGGTEPVMDRGREGHSIFAFYFIKVLQENEAPYLVPSFISDQVGPLVARNAEQLPRSEPLQGAGDEGGQFVFRLVAAGKSYPPGEANLEAERKQLELERQRLLAEREALDREKHLVEERTRLEAERRRLEEERQRLKIAPPDQRNRFKEEYGVLQEKI